MTSTDAGGVGDVTLQRSFGWGVLFIGDSKARIVEVNPHIPITWGREDETIAVLVRHAQDVDNPVLDGLAAGEEVPLVEVTVRVHWGRAAEGATDGDGCVAVPSGVATVGDADSDDRFLLTPGRWRVQVSLDPQEHAERVDVWLSSCL